MRQDAFYSVKVHDAGGTLKDHAGTGDIKLTKGLVK
jgi:hypothetical protein